MPDGRTRRAPLGLVLAAVAAAAYLNTLPAEFTFDDSFAVVSHPSVHDIMVHPFA